MTKAPCILCERPMFLRLSRGKYFLAPICLGCKSRLDEELGAGWENQEWWVEMKRAYYAERGSTWRNEINQESLDGMRDDPMRESEDVADLDGHPVGVVDYTISGIIQRLYRTYGYGNRKIHAILINSYRLNISRRTVAHVLADIKQAGIQPDEDAPYWRNWHQTLARLEKEYGIV